MSRIQNILDKADREGGVRRMRSVADAGAASALSAVEAPVLPAPSIVADPLTPVSVVQTPTGQMPVTQTSAVPSGTVAPPAVLTPPGARVVTGANLDRRLVAAMSPDATAAEQYRALRTRIVHADNGAPVNVILITSPGRGEGKTLTAANLGLTMAQEYQHRICVIDADLRHPQMHRLFGVSDAPGLSDVLAGQATLDEALVFLEEHQITVLPSGFAPAHPAELLGTTVMRRMVDTLRTRFDRVIIDAPAAAPLADVGVLTPLVDSVVLVIRAGVTAKPAIHEAIAAIDATKLLGVVLNETA
jgi:capsular exopolysaccharide synthesis family protein